jgi:predicted phage-related endonuclease
VTRGRPELCELAVEHFPTRAAWLASRADRRVIGASEAAMALGVSPYGTAWSLWESKQGPTAEKRGDQLQRGQRWESAVLAEYEDESGREVLTPSTAVQLDGGIVVLANRRVPWLRETPDAFAIDRRGELGQVEAKTAVQAHVWSPEPGIVIERWDDAHASLIPPHIAIQGYVQLIVTDLPWVDVCALVPRGRWLTLRYVRLERDVDTQQQLESALTEWRERHLLHGEPPAVDGSEACNHYLARAFPSASGARKPQRGAAPDELARMVELAEVRQQIKALEARADLLRNELLQRAEGHKLTVGFKTGPYGQTEISAGRLSVDLEGLRREAPELVARHEHRGAPSAAFKLYRFDQIKRALPALDRKES